MIRFLSPPPVAVCFSGNQHSSPSRSPLPSSCRCFLISLRRALVNLLSAITSPERQRRPLSIAAGRMVGIRVPEWGNACPGLSLGSPWLRLRSAFTVERKGLRACVCKFSPLLSGNDTGALQHGWIRMAFEYLNAIHMGKTAGFHVCAYSSTAAMHEICKRYNLGLYPLAVTLQKSSPLYFEVKLPNSCITTRSIFFPLRLYAALASAACNRELRG